MDNSTENLELRVEFPDVSDADAARYARDLEAMLRKADASIKVERLQSDSRSQDAGSVLAVILGSASFIALCRGIGAHIAKRGDRIRVSLPEGTIIAEGRAAENVDATELVAALKNRRRAPQATSK